MEIEIRKIQMEDLSGMAYLYKGLWNEESNLECMKFLFGKIKSNQDYFILNAFSNGKIIGTILGIVCYSLYGDCKPFLVVEDFIIDDNFKRKGIGRKLLHAIENEGKARGCNQVILVTDFERKDTQRFYESCGYPSGRNVGYKKKLV